MLGKIADIFHGLIGRGTSYLQTFTFYIPAPPNRNSGYRESEFDRLFYEFINQDQKSNIKIIDIKTQSHQSAEGGGFWFIATIEANRKLTYEDLPCLQESGPESIVLDDGLEIVHEE